MITERERLLTADEVGILVNAAATAPSMHNTQPWRFEVCGRVVDVILDEERSLPAEDRAGRMILIGLGAATFNLRVAAAMLGYETTFATHPDPDRPEIVTRVFLGGRQSPMPLGSLYGELRRRHTYRGPLLAMDIPQQVLSLISTAARIEGSDLFWLEPSSTRELIQILREADELDLHDEDRLTERGRWIGGDRSEDGVPERALDRSPPGRQPSATSRRASTISPAAPASSRSSRGSGCSVPGWTDRPNGSAREWPYNTCC